MWCAVNRVTPAGRVAGPEQRISAEEALRAVTIEAAYSWQKENDLGSITPGKIANFTVLDEDPLTAAPMKLNEIAIWGTVFEGRIFPVSVKSRVYSHVPGGPSFIHGHLHDKHKDGDGHHAGDPCAVARQVTRALMANVRGQKEK
jgi:hypothetical protein